MRSILPRQFKSRLPLVVMAIFASLLPAAAPTLPPKSPTVAGHKMPAAIPTPTEGLKKLEAGNLRFASGKPLHPDQTKARRAELASGQKPFAAILCCADSRVPPEILFDQGLGDLFVVRTAGEALDEAALGSLEYAVEHLGVKLIYVVGHERCGAVAAAVEAHKTGHYPEGAVMAVVSKILPAVGETTGQSGDPVARAVSAQVRHAAADLIKRLSPHGESHLLVAGGVYDLDTGRVTREF